MASNAPRAPSLPPPTTIPSPQYQPPPPPTTTSPEPCQCRPPHQDKMSHPAYHTSYMRGPTIKLIIGHGLSAVHYTLPIRLLAVNSELLTRDMSQMLSLNGATAGLHIKRKTPHDSSPEMTRKPFSELSADASTGRSEIPRVEAAKAEMVLQYSQMEMDSFGLFLRFMLTGDYPVGVDVGFAAVWVPWCSREAWVWKGMAWDVGGGQKETERTSPSWISAERKPSTGTSAERILTS
ncbi:predicted protein [Plenodomus lingam JN3]|uniref:Predicted protein n=1 Tax=Leptosphaeria maculans (strain JN3 / isolate v23.1.3 / race Av1-4-5-6-7-8) TaxID=985895 RepID=E4ZIR3_LEPMJ|nr:predicted protein [Plenodomus lingam JN3]CBX91084.1 predicted protein [Plenodomus lingam JN3]